MTLGEWINGYYGFANLNPKGFAIIRGQYKKHDHSTKTWWKNASTM